MAIRKHMAHAACVVLVVVVALLPASTAGAAVDSVGGGATGVDAEVTLLLQPLVTIGPLPNVTLPSTGGGPFTDSAVSINVPGVLQTGLLSVSAQGGNLGSHAGFATASASVANVVALTTLLTADVISSTCTSNGDGSVGSTSLVNAVIAGTTVAATPLPNSVVNVANVATITLNEQIVTNVVGTTSSILVNAVHIELNGILASGDIVIGQSTCQVDGPDVLNPDPTDPPVDPPVDSPDDTPGDPSGNPGGTPATTPPPTSSVPIPPRFVG
jgi:hypothetical protein